MSAASDPGADVSSRPIATQTVQITLSGRLPDQALVQLTGAARAAGSRWDAIAAACGIQSYQDLAGVVDRITSEPARTCCSPPLSTRLNS